MRRRNTKIHEFTTPQGAKVLTAKFGNKSKSVLASGDNLNNVCLWKISKEKPLMTLNNGTGSSQSAQVEVTSVGFNNQDTEVFSGSNRGVINIWDITSEKITITLKGHTVAVNCFNIFPLDDCKNLLISGSYDTQVKVWDLRQRSAVVTLKGHNMQVNCIAGSPDGKLIVSGSSDGAVKLWDMSTSKVIHNFLLHDASISCIKFNPMDMAMASGGADKTVKYWDLEHFQLISSTRPDTTPIQEIVFSADGRALFSAAHESLKVWNVEKEGVMLDNVESQWRGVQDMAISDVDDMLLGLSATQAQFSLFACPLSLINLSEENIPKKPVLIVQKQSAVQSQVQQQVQPQQGLQPSSYLQQYKQQQVQNNLQGVQFNINQALQNLNLVTNDMDLQRQEKIREQMSQFDMTSINPSYMPPPPQLIEQQQLKKSNSMENKSPSKEIKQEIIYQNQNIVQNKNEEIEEEIKVGDEVRDVEEEFKYQESPQNDNLEQSTLTIHDSVNENFNFSVLYQGKDKEKFLQFDLINDILKEHGKVDNILNQRLNYLKPIQHWWASGNSKSAIYAINQLNDPCVILDSIQVATTLNKFEKITIEGATILISKMKDLIESKYKPHIKGGLLYTKKFLDQHRDEIISIKNFQGLSKNDLARDERVLQYTNLLEEFKKIHKLPKLKKIATKEKHELGELGKRLLIDLEYLLSKTD